MSRKEMAIQFARENLHILQCPICEQAFHINTQSIRCENHHTYDFSKQGYVNLLTRAVKTAYDKSLFDSRQHMIVHSELYQPLHDTIAQLLNDKYEGKMTMADLGCGEGSHLMEIMKRMNKPAVPIGIDISKEGILTAAKTYKNSLWLVGDLAKTPLKDQSIDVLLNILSPANYKEFKRIAADNALFIKVVPGKHYLQELREFLFGNRDETSEPAELFKQQVQPDAIIPIQYKRGLNYEELTQLVQMTPLTWSADRSKVQRFLQQAPREITIDVTILAAAMNK